METYNSIEVTKQLVKDGKISQEIAETIFPQLKESEDERIRKAIKHLVKSTKENHFGIDNYDGVKWNDILAWLEKQGEQNPKSADFIPTDCTSDAKNENRWHKVEGSLPDNAREVLCKDAIGNFFIGRYYNDGDYWEVSMYAEPNKSNKDNPPVIMWANIPSCKQNLANSAKTCKDEQSQKHFELKAGHWYICRRAFCCRADHLTVKEGERFMCKKDGVVKGFVIKEPEKYFKEVYVPAPMEDEPKFKVGDWVILTAGELSTTLQIVNVDTNKKLYWFNDNSYLPIVDDDCLHLWTIQDAKDGDVLSFNDGHGNDSIELIKSITDKKIEFWFCFTNGNRYEVFDGITPYTNLVSREDATPATKEQCDQLEKAMADAGYRWNPDEKKMEKIEQNPAWSEEDYDAIEMAIIALEDMYDEKAPDTTYGGYNLPFNKAAERLESLKERYTRTDAFIEKACEWIERNMDDYIYVEYDTATGLPTNEAHIAYKKVVEDFKNYMKGE